MLPDFMHEIFYQSANGEGSVTFWLSSGASLNGKVMHWTEKQVLVEKSFIDGSPSQIAVNRNHISYCFLVPDEN